MQAEIYNIDYSRVVHILGTTHFSRKSLYDAYRAVNQLRPTDLGIELDMKRYRTLNEHCSSCSRSGDCTRKCEFIAAVEALQNRDTNIWLIDMARSEFFERMRRSQHPYSHWRVLLKERDALMAARLAWITSESLKKAETPRVLALVGAAHVRGLRSLLQTPIAIKESLRKLDLSFTPPTLIRRIGVNGD